MKKKKKGREVLRFTDDVTEAAPDNLFVSVVVRDAGFYVNFSNGKRAVPVITVRTDGRMAFNEEIPRIGFWGRLFNEITGVEYRVPVGLGEIIQVKEG